MRTPILMLMVISALWASTASAQTDDFACAQPELLGSIGGLETPPT